MNSQTLTLHFLLPASEKVSALEELMMPGSIRHRPISLTSSAFPYAYASPLGMQVFHEEMNKRVFVRFGTLYIGLPGEVKSSEEQVYLIIYNRKQYIIHFYQQYYLETIYQKMFCSFGVSYETLRYNNFRSQTYWEELVVNTEQRLKY